MEGKLGNQALTFEEFEPFCKWQRKEDRDILEIQLQDFKKEQMKVQISNHGMLKISGERALDASRKSKFYKELSISNTYDASTIAAKFINGWLYITMPKIKNKVPESKNDKKSIETSKNDQTPKPESTKYQAQPHAPPPNHVNAENPQTKYEFQGPKPAGRALKLAKVAVSLAATAVAVAALVAYVIYMYKSTIIEIDDCN